jgi:hypothetical protein
VAALAFLFTLAATAMVYSSIPKQYVSTAVLVLTMPITGATQALDGSHPYGITNPLMDFDPGLSLTASIEIQSLSAPETVAKLGLTPGGTTSYIVSDGSTNPELAASSPFIYIQGTSAHAADAQGIVQKVSDLVGQDLAQKQAHLDAPASTYISVSVVVPPTAAQINKGTRIRAAGATLALGIFASLAAVFAAESLFTARARRKALRKSASEADSAPPAVKDMVATSAVSP